MEKDISIKKIDSKIKNMDIILQQEKNKYIAMENGYAPSYFFNDVTKKNKHNVIKL